MESGEIEKLKEENERMKNEVAEMNQRLTERLEAHFLEIDKYRAREVLNRRELKEERERAKELEAQVSQLTEKLKQYQDETGQRSSV